MTPNTGETAPIGQKFATNAVKCIPFPDDFLVKVELPENPEETEEARIIDFFKSVVEVNPSKQNMQQLWTNYAEERGNREPWTYFDKIFREQIAPKIYQLDLSVRTKVLLLFCTGSPINYQFLSELKNNAYVQVNEFNVIFYYKEKDGDGFRLPVIQKRTVVKTAKVVKTGKSSESDTNRTRGRGFTTEEEIQMLDFLAATAEREKTLISMRAMWVAYKKKYNSKRGIKSLHLRFRSRLAPMIHKLSRYDNATKVRMIYASATRVDEAFEEKIRGTADFEIDSDGYFVSYRELKKPDEFGSPTGCIVEKKPIDMELSFGGTTNDRQDLNESKDGLLDKKQQLRVAQQDEPVHEFEEEEEEEEDVKPNIGDLRAQWKE